MNLNFIKQQIKREVYKNPEIENCGLILYNDVIFPCKNESKTPKDSFIIYPADFDEAHKLGSIVGFYHNHPTGTDFSELDKLICEQTKLKCFLYNLSDDSLQICEPKNYEVPYINRPFLLGIFDCLTLVTDYYKREYNIEILSENFEKYQEIINAERTENKEYEPTQNIILECFQKNGFGLINNLEKGDVIISRILPMTGFIHCAIFMGAGNILHQPMSLFSKIEAYSDYYKNRTIFKLRHKTRM